MPLNKISFPRAPKEEGEVVSDQVTVKGPASCVAAAVAMIKDNVDNFESQITDSVDIDRIHHRVIIGKGGEQVQEVSTLRIRTYPKSRFDKNLRKLFFGISYIVQWGTIRPDYRFYGITLGVRNRVP